MSPGSGGAACLVLLSPDGTSAVRDVDAADNHAMFGGERAAAGLTLMYGRGGCALSLILFYLLLHLPSYEAGVEFGWPSRPAFKPCRMPCMQLPRVAASSGLYAAAIHSLTAVTPSNKAMCLYLLATIAA
jgi:hypothetical protein